MEAKDKSEFIGNYLQKKIKNHNLPYGITYLNLVAKHESDAEKKWNKIKKTNPR